MPTTGGNATTEKYDAIGIVTLPCGGRSLNIRELIAQLDGVALGKKKCFVANQVYFNILILLSRTARQIRIHTRPKFPGKWTAFDNEYKRAVEAFEELEANEPYLNPMPEAQSFKRRHFDIKEGQDVKVVRHSLEIVPVERLVEFVESWKGQQQQANGNACLCKELVDHCVQKTTFSQQFMEIFFKECSSETKKLAPKRGRGEMSETKKPTPKPAPKRSRGEMTEMKKPASKVVLGELVECSHNPTQTSFNAQEGSTMTSKIGVMKTVTKADCTTNSYNHTTNFNFNSPAVPACDGALGLLAQIQNLQAREQFLQGVVGTYANCLQQNGIPLPKIEVPANLQTQIMSETEAPSTPIQNTKKVAVDPNFINRCFPMSAGAFASVGHSVFDSTSTTRRRGQREK